MRATARGWSARAGDARVSVPALMGEGVAPSKPLPERVRMGS